ncbi:hypothetical protein H4Q26_013731 [Puccinia striiformis f. sp. tritici PST-130]|nr:hypothetical protein H4Q26_013731 [Puccinia striiformis f. sp. tritici PST-130]
MIFSSLALSDRSSLTKSSYLFQWEFNDSHRLFGLILLDSPRQSVGNWVFSVANLLYFRGIEINISRATIFVQRSTKEQTITTLLLLKRLLILLL